ncbi:MAG: CoA transferase [Planctomycetes bacterium]|nr:CoA transferase [Planctomycetota bacterium]
MTSQPLPLAGIRVLDLSRILAGPVCTQVLADLGADVVKIERPGQGDDTRHWGPPFVAGLADGSRGPSAYFLSCNRNKRSLALDLASAAGREVLDGLVGRADVLVENFLADSLPTLGLTPDRLRQLNPRLVCCSISAYGRQGPLAGVPGYDLMIQAGSGLMGITGDAAGAPMKVGVAITDVLTGLYTATSALAGLLARERGQPARAFDLALADCTLASLVNVAQSTLLTGQRPQRWGNAHPQIVPYEVFPTADGYVVLAIGADRQWVRFCQRVGRDEWTTDVRFATNPARVEHRTVLVPLVDHVMRTRTTADWQQALTEAEVPHTVVVPLDQAVHAPHVVARQMIHTVTDRAGRSYQLLGSPIHWSDAERAPPSAPPELGEHTDEVLIEWLGYTPAQITTLRQQNVIAG